MTREEYESWLRVEKEVHKISSNNFTKNFINLIFQVAELKRKLELEEMHKFRQMSRPNSTSTTILNSQTRDDIDHEDFSSKTNFIHDENEDDDDEEMFLENDYYTYSSNEE